MSKYAKIIEEVEKLNVLELSELVKALEEKFGVSAAMPVMAAPAGGGSAGAGDTVEKTAFDVHLVSGGDQKIQVIKVVRELTGLGLKEAKDLVDAAPKAVKTGVPKAEADDMKAKLEAAGAKAEVK
ncbi:50S ribosomal protein L7/L12 [Candidatus Parcubacteria bacterium]|nr:MAG: 50S ribosomal protein L7/L12 [Candidatus Parcubacteria bacterium]